MLFSQKALFALVCGLLAINVTGHPGHDATAEMMERAAYMNKAGRRSLSSCSLALKERGISERAQLRRRAVAEKLRKERAIESGECFLIALKDNLLMQSSPIP
jgi:hypothetical protein